MSRLILGRPSHYKNRLLDKIEWPTPLETGVKLSLASGGTFVETSGQVKPFVFSGLIVILRTGWVAG